ncbi:hypothetical protein QCA50_002466 [Cerrena zonata]|uniref:Uncharacterized protein n=1 Tax=Cerrena zonata TaxID=2478898 RepID=A0AAW0GRJ4_9APHY
MSDGELRFFSLYIGPHNQPPFALCLLQAALIHAAPSMCTISTFIVILQVWYLFQLPWHPWLLFFSRLSPIVRFLLVIAPPYLAFIVITIASIMIGLRGRSFLTANLGLYCTIDLKIFFVPVVFCALCMVSMLMLSAGILIQYYWRQRPIPHLQFTTHRGSAVKIWLRVLVFNLYSMVTLGASLLYFVSASNPLPYMIQAALPVVALLVFGSQADIIRTFAFWSRSNSPDDTDQRASHGGWSAPTDANQLSSDVTTTGASHMRNTAQLSTIIFIGSGPSRS